MLPPALRETRRRKRDHCQSAVMVEGISDLCLPACPASAKLLSGASLICSMAHALSPSADVNSCAAHETRRSHHCGHSCSSSSSSSLVATAKSMAASQQLAGSCSHWELHSLSAKPCKSTLVSLLCVSDSLQHSSSGCMLLCSDEPQEAEPGKVQTQRIQPIVCMYAPSCMSGLVFSLILYVVSGIVAQIGLSYRAYQVMQTNARQSCREDKMKARLTGNEPI